MEVALGRSPEPLRVTLIVMAGAPPLESLVHHLSTEAIDLEAREEAVLSVRPAAPDRRVALVWAPEEVPDRALAAVLAWRAGAAAPILLLGCAPEAHPVAAERALAAGFEDFMAGRRSPREVAARLRALARRASGTLSHGSDRFSHGRVVLDRARHELMVDGRRLPLTVTEVTVMTALVAAHGRVLSRDALLDLVWGEDDLDVGLRAVDNLILRLRRKIGDPDLLVTVRGIGFRLGGGSHDSPDLGGKATQALSEERRGIGSQRAPIAASDGMKTTE